MAWRLCFYENSEPNANTSNINEFRQRPYRLTGTFRLGHSDSQDERGMFLRQSDTGFHGWTMLQPGGPQCEQSWPWGKLENWQ